MTAPAPLTYPLDEAAQVIGCSVTWLTKQVRAERIEHCRFGRDRRLTAAQIAKVIASRTNTPAPRSTYVPPSKRRMSAAPGA